MQQGFADVGDSGKCLRTGVFGHPSFCWASPAWSRQGGLWRGSPCGCSRTPPLPGLKHLLLRPRPVRMVAGGAGILGGAPHLHLREVPAAVHLPRGERYTAPSRRASGAPPPALGLDTHVFPEQTLLARGLDPRHVHRGSLNP